MIVQQIQPSAGRKASCFRIFLLVAFVLSCFASTSFAQLSVGNRFVTARVFPNSGRVTITTTANGYYDNGRGPMTLSFPDKSYFTCKINGVLYTNNEVSNYDFTTYPNFGSYLYYGDSYITGDTIRTTWILPAGELSQDVYPVAFDFSGQIVMKWKYKNKAPTVAGVQAQFLLDTKVRSNDRSKVLTRFGYRRNWSGYVENNDNYKPIPPFYQAFENDLDSANGFNPGLISQGTFISPEMGLMKPDAVLIGDWENNLSGTPWGWPSVLPTDEYGDSGVLIVFPSKGVITGANIEIGRTAYGTGQFETCTGNIYALIYRPRIMRPNAAGTDYTPNPFDVEMYLFNTDKYTSAANTYVTLTVGPHLTILDSLGVPIGSNSQKFLASPPNIGLGSVSTALWHVHADKNCLQDTSFLEFYCQSTLGNPSFNRQCRLPVILPCLDKDTLPPIAEPVVSNGFFKSIGFRDNRIADKGIESIQTFGFNPTFFRVTVDAFSQCTKTSTPVVVHMQQLDSTVAGCITIRVTDCAKNVTIEQVCFPRYPLHPDTIPPRFVVISRFGSYDGSLCNMKRDSLLAIDDTTYDKGLQSITVVPSTTPTNMRLDVGTIVAGTSRQGFNISVIDSMADGCISVRATDLAGNFVDTTICYCTIPDNNPPVTAIFQTTPYAWAVYVTDVQPYDRRIDTISVTSRNNIRLVKNGVAFEPTRTQTRGRSNYDFNIEVIDTNLFASFCVRTKDLADSSSLADATHWWSKDTCASRDTIQDIWAPNILLDPPPFFSPTVVHVIVNDLHYYNSTDLIGWDRGIDSIWFTNVYGMTVPATIHGDCKVGPFKFDVSVTDPMSLDTLATVCIHVLDCAGNRSDTCWYYPIKTDNTPPQILSDSTSRTKLDLVITDSTQFDRGLRHTILDSAVNFDPFERWDNGSRIVSAPLVVTKYGSSSTGTLHTIDLYGAHSTSTAEQAAHSASVDVAIWAQDITFKPSNLMDQATDFKLPIYFVKNDTFPLAKKGITSFSFSFTLNGYAGFTYQGFDKINTASQTFDVRSAIVGNIITITGRSILGDSLMLGDSALLYVIIHAANSETTNQVILIPSVVGSNTVSYNDNLNHTVTGQNASAVLPAPYGTMSSGTIVAIGSCSPKIGNAYQPSVAGLEQNFPNPFKGVTQLTYQVAKPGFVSLIIYDALGREVTRLVNSDSPVGQFSVNFNPVNLTNGSYVARLETGGKVISRRMVLSH
jgi:hypothetical protein